MSSLLEYEGLGGQVQMIYIDPPYGVKFGSNFQPFVRRRDVKDGSDNDLTREPEMVQAYRDTWELGLHSYLTYLRDRLLLCRELLAPTGSILVQISDENLHHVREVMDEMFGEDNSCGVISFQKTTSASGARLHAVADYLLWYARDVQYVKFSVCGLPEVELKKLKKNGKNGTVKYQAKLLGLDVFDPVQMTVSHKRGNDVPAWFLDTDYNGLCFHVSQAFFPRTAAWVNLRKALT